MVPVRAPLSQRSRNIRAKQAPRAPGQCSTSLAAVGRRVTPGLARCAFRPINIRVNDLATAP
jgi:hypothetical protein